MLTREDIINKVRNLAKELGVTSLSRKTFISKSGISEWQIINLFDSWNEVILEAGLMPAANIKVEDEELFQSMIDVFLKYKGICTRRKFEKIGRYCTDVYTRRFGSWAQALSAFQDWLKLTGKDFPYMAALVTQTKQTASVPMEDNQIKTQQDDSSIVYSSTKGATRYGAFLNFRGLQHAPTNEQGVVFLFGMICFELGYVVEAVKPGFPDCEAKRKIAGRKDQWERIKIEFEFQSKQFVEHGHNEKGCDLIVCWEHNWPDCPLEVLELRKVIEQLSE